MWTKPANRERQALADRRSRANLNSAAILEIDGGVITTWLPCLTLSLTSTSVLRARGNLSAVRDTVLDDHHVEAVAAENDHSCRHDQEPRPARNLELDRTIDPWA